MLFCCLSSGLKCCSPSYSAKRGKQILRSNYKRIFLGTFLGVSGLQLCNNDVILSNRLIGRICRYIQAPFWGQRKMSACSQTPTHSPFLPPPPPSTRKPVFSLDSDFAPQVLAYLFLYLVNVLHFLFKCEHLHFKMIAAFLGVLSFLCFRPEVTWPQLLIFGAKRNCHACLGMCNGW